ncbi:MAG: (5-formylfuran-3-yl)methyl phosphate synthase [Methylophilaceae bacterium]
MTKLLASVKDKHEALMVLNAGVDIIDLKNPDQGALGALRYEDIAEIVALVNGAGITSATIGDLPMVPELIVQAMQSTAETGVDIVKVGFFPSARSLECIEAISALNQNGMKVVAVLFADRHPDFGLLDHFKHAGFFGVMLDTAGKDGRHLLDHLPLSKAGVFIEQAKALGLVSGLAGSLRLDHLHVLKPLNPDYIGFRGALCNEADRKSALCDTRLQTLKAMLHKNNIAMQNAVHA